MIEAERTPIVALGTTGMLAGATLALADRGHPIWVLARGALAFVDRHAPNRVLKALPIDYAKDSFDRLRDLPDHATLIAWIHGDAMPILSRITKMLSPSRVIHVVGSSSAQPSRSEEPILLDRPFHYHRVVLGFVIEDGGSRWLTHREISQGVLDAFDTPSDVSTVGSVEPWSARP